MDIIYSFIIGVIQGLTEFLPVSSSAHLVLLPKIMGVKSEFLHSLTFDVVLHFGTLVAVLIYYRNKITNLIISFVGGIFCPQERKKPDFKLSVLIIAATMPAFFAGYFLENYAETTFRNPIVIAIVLIIFAILLFWADKNKNLSKDISQISMKDAIIIGCFQALAIIPGVSRSGVTITAALFLGFKREESAEFSFLLSVPVIFGAFVFEIKDIIRIGAGGENILILLVGFISSFVAGFIAIFFLINFVKKNSFLPFVVYRILLGITIMALFLRF